MKAGNDIFFTPKFWPERENWSMPSDEGVDFDNLSIMHLFAYRQKFRLYYRNWVAVWRTYVYYLKYAFIIVPIIYLITRSWWIAGITLVILVAAKMFAHKKLNFFNQIRFFVPGILDSYLENQFGDLLPFND